MAIFMILLGLVCAYYALYRTRTQDTDRDILGSEKDDVESARQQKRTQKVEKHV